jgi:carbamoyltransferase
LRDGAIIGCASEERFSRLKNDAGYPRRAVDALLAELGLTVNDLDLVALAGREAYPRDWMNRVLRDDDYARTYYGVTLAGSRSLKGRARKLGARLGFVGRTRGKSKLSEIERLAPIITHLGLPRRRVVTFDHHACHAASAYFGGSCRSDDTLVLTNDNAGDGLCATASRGAGMGIARREAVPSAPGSLGSFYSYATLLLGMKFGEHEYKVMGLAPFADESATACAAEAFHRLLSLTPTEPATFAWTGRRGSRYRQMLAATLGLRFDAVAAGAQRALEEWLLRWSRLMRERHGGERLALGGGVFMNVKANMLLAAEDWVRDIFVFPSCGDESNAVGAAYLGYLDLCAARGIEPAPQPFGPAYLGPGLSNTEIEAVLRRRDIAGRHRVTEHERVEEQIAELLVRDGVVARCAGRMEFGARALGNRSILAHPGHPAVVPLINRMIKHRDFWMPFAPSILAERANDYLVNPKGLTSPYMMLAFATKTERRSEIEAAVHPHDGTARAHILDASWNPDYHRVVTEFERRTGTGAVLNTSFNLHGEPIVCSADDALDTFEASGLPHLALGRWVVSKK